MAKDINWISHPALSKKWPVADKAVLARLAIGE
jgi:hypothetical protein